MHDCYASIIVLTNNSLGQWDSIGKKKQKQKKKGLARPKKVLPL